MIVKRPLPPTKQPQLWKDCNGEPVEISAVQLAATCEINLDAETLAEELFRQYLKHCVKIKSTTK